MLIQYNLAMKSEFDIKKSSHNKIKSKHKLKAIDFDKTFDKGSEVTQFLNLKSVKKAHHPL